ncbi:hypothetical protein [Desnuesiella massiliensis]|nr:hypothetical protein [Desnuesiella massiliensis]
MEKAKLKRIATIFTVITTIIAIISAEKLDMSLKHSIYRVYSLH